MKIKLYDIFDYYDTKSNKMSKLKVKPIDISSVLRQVQSKIVTAMYDKTLRKK